MFDIGLPEFFVLGVIALLVFGPDRLPEVALQAARLIRRLKGMAESARSDLSADLEPHMRELRELRELDPRKMAKRYVTDPIDEDGTLKNLRGKNLLSETAKKPAKTKKVAEAGAVAAAGGVAAANEVPTAPATNGSGTEVGGVDRAALPPAMAPAVTPAGERPPYDLDAT